MVIPIRELETDNPSSLSCSRSYCGQIPTHYATINLYGMSLEILLCQRHAEMLMDLCEEREG